MYMCVCVCVYGLEGDILTQMIMKVFMMLRINLKEKEILI